MEIDNTTTETLEFVHKKLVMCDGCEYWVNCYATKGNSGYVTKREQYCRNYDMCKRAVEKYIEMKGNE